MKQIQHNIFFLGVLFAFVVQSLSLANPENGALQLIEEAASLVRDSNPYKPFANIVIPTYVHELGEVVELVDLKDLDDAITQVDNLAKSRSLKNMISKLDSAMVQRGISDATDEALHLRRDQLFRIQEAAKFTVSRMKDFKTRVAGVAEFYIGKAGKKAVGALAERAMVGALLRGFQKMSTGFVETFVVRRALYLVPIVGQAIAFGDSFLTGIGWDNAVAAQEIKNCDEVYAWIGMNLMIESSYTSASRKLRAQYHAKFNQYINSLNRQPTWEDYYIPREDTSTSKVPPDLIKMSKLLSYYTKAINVARKELKTMEKFSSDRDAMLYCFRNDILSTVERQRSLLNNPTQLEERLDINGVPDELQPFRDVAFPTPIRRFPLPQIAVPGIDGWIDFYTNGIGDDIDSDSVLDDSWLQEMLDSGGHFLSFQSTSDESGPFTGDGYSDSGDSAVGVKTPTPTPKVIPPIGNAKSNTTSFLATQPVVFCQLTNKNNAWHTYVPVDRPTYPNRGNECDATANTNRRVWTIESRSAFRAFSSPNVAANLHPIHRMYNPNNGQHYYTLSSGEKDSLVRLGWHYETQVVGSRAAAPEAKSWMNQGYLVPIPSSSFISYPGTHNFISVANPPAGMLEIFHGYNSVTSDHFYTTDANYMKATLQRFPDWLQQTSLGFGPGQNFKPLQSISAKPAASKSVSAQTKSKVVPVKQVVPKKVAPLPQGRYRVGVDIFYSFGNYLLCKYDNPKNYERGGGTLKNYRQITRIPSTHHSYGYCNVKGGKTFGPKAGGRK